MKILFVTSRYYPHHGGLETVVREIASKMASMGHRVEVVTNRYPRTLTHKDHVDGIKVTRFFFLFPRRRYLQEKRLDLWLAGAFFFPVTLVRLFLLIKKFKPEIINLHYLGDPALFLLIARKMLRFHFIVSLHGGDVDGEPYRSRFNLWLFRKVLKDADAVTTCSKVLLDQAVELAPEIKFKIKVVHNGVNVELFANATPYSHPKPYLLAVGQLERHKGFDLLIDAFSQMQDEKIGFDLLIAGDGSMRRELEDQIRKNDLGDRVHLLGGVSQQKVASLMRGSRGVVIPSRREPFGIVALEARAANKPIVASNVGGLPEALRGSNAVLIEPENGNALMQALMDVVNRKNGSHLDPGISALGWHAVSEYYQQIYASVL